MAIARPEEIFNPFSEPSDESLVSKTVGGYVADFDGYRINLPEGLLQKIHESVEKSTNRDSYWLGYLLSKVKPRLKRAKCRLCKKHIRGVEAQPRNMNSYMPYPFHKKCYEIARKREASNRFIRDASSDVKKKRLNDPADMEEIKKIGSGLAQTLSKVRKSP